MLLRTQGQGHHRCVIKPSSSIVPRIVFIAERNKIILKLVMALSQTHVLSCVELSVLPLCFAAVVPCAQTVEASPRGPWTVVTFRHPFVKVKASYVWFIAQSLPPFAAYNMKLVGCTLDKKKCCCCSSFCLASSQSGSPVRRSLNFRLDFVVLFHRPDGVKFIG